MEGKIRKKLIAVGGYPFASLHPLEGAAAQLSSHRRVGDFWRRAFGGRYRSGDALSGALAMLGALVFGVLIAATDPVSVIAIFKEAKAHGRLLMLIEAESRF